MKRVVLVLAFLISVVSADKIVKLDIKGMMCPACVSNVKSSLNGVNGVKNADVFLRSGKAEVTAADETKSEALCEAVTKAGYKCKLEK